MADPVRGAADAAAEGAKKVGNAAVGVTKWAANQINPLPGGKFTRTLMITTALAGVGFVAATGGFGSIALPFGAAAAGAGTAAGTTAAAAPTIGQAVGSALTTFGGHAGNGIATIVHGASQVPAAIQGLMTPAL